MGRFSKLETGTGPSPDEQPEDGPFGLRLKPQPRQRDESTAPDYDQGYYLADGDKLFFSGEYQKALRAYSRAMEVDHSAVTPWVGQILSLIKLKQTREAAVWAMRAVELFPEDPRLVSLQGLTLVLTGSRQRAISCSDFALTLPGGATAFTWMIRAQILAAADNPNAAFCLDKVMETRDPGDWRVLALTGDFLLEQKKWARALEFLRLATEAQPSNGWLWKRLGLANEKVGLSQPAMQAYRAALDINSNDREAQDLIKNLRSVPLPIRLWNRLKGAR